MRIRRDWRAGSALRSLIMPRTWPLQAVAISLGLLMPPLAVIPLDLARRIVDEAIPAGDMARLASLAGWAAAAVLAHGAVKFSVIVARHRIAEIVARTLRAALVDSQRRRAPPRRRQALGAATAVMAGEVDPVGGFVAEALATPVVQGGTLVAVGGFMLATEPALAAVGVAALVTEATVTPVLQHRINQLSYRRIRAIRRAGHGLVAAAGVDGAGQGGGAGFAAALAETRRAYRLRLAMAWFKAGLKTVNRLIDNLSELAVLGVGAAMVTSGQTELGVVVAFIAALRRLRGPWGELIGYYRRLADARVKYRLIHGLLRAEPGPVARGASGARRPEEG